MDVQILEFLEGVAALDEIIHPGSISQCDREQLGGRLVRIASG